MVVHTEKNGSTSESWWLKKYRSNEIWALVFGGFSVMLFLALFSYRSADLPSAIAVSGAVEESGAVQNFVGPFGAILAGALLFAGGAAGYVIPVVLLWWGAQIMVTKRFPAWPNFVAMIVLFLSVACIVDCQAVVFQDWIERFDLPDSNGGVAGYFIGHSFFVRFFGPAGTFIIMSIISLVAVNVITGVHPIRLARLFVAKVSRFFRDRSLAKQEEMYPVARALPVAKTISFEPVFEEDVTVEAEPVAFQSVDDSDEIAPDVKVVSETPVAPAVPETPVPERVRKIINTTQAQHHGVSKPRSKPMQAQSPISGKPQFEGYQLPSLGLLSYAKDLDVAETNDDALIQIQNHIVRTLNSFKVEVEPGDITRGPTVTRYEVYPSPGLRVNKIAALKDDIARATRAERINILAPIPGKDTVGIEIANSNKVTVAIRELFESATFRDSSAKLPLVLGKDVYGKVIIGDLSRMPHLLVAGATGSGKSVCINSIIASLLYRFTPDELKFIMIDPKVVELQLYNSLPHMVVPVVTDPKKVILALRWVIKEMESRYEMFAKKGVRSFEGFNDLRQREIRGQEMAEQKVLQPNLFNTETGEDFLEGDGFGEEIDPGAVTDGEECRRDFPTLSSSLTSWPTSCRPLRPMSRPASPGLPRRRAPPGFISSSPRRLRGPMSSPERSRRTFPAGSPSRFPPRPTAASSSMPTGPRISSARGTCSIFRREAPR